MDVETVQDFTVAAALQRIDLPAQQGVFLRRPRGDVFGDLRGVVFGNLVDIRKMEESVLPGQVPERCADRLVAKMVIFSVVEGSVFVERRRGGSHAG